MVALILFILGFIILPLVIVLHINTAKSYKVPFSPLAREIIGNPESRKELFRALENRYRYFEHEGTTYEICSDDVREMEEKV